MSRRKKKQDRIRQILLGGGAVVALGLIVWMAWGLAQPDAPPPPELALVETFDDMGTEHNDSGVPVAYNSDPPTSGPHSSFPASCGIYRQSVPDENQLHSMEHGTVVFQYDPGIDATEIAVIENVAREQRSDILVAPRSGMAAPIVLTAWTKMLQLDTADEDVLRAFFQEYSNRSPEGGALCPFEVDQGA